MPDSLQMKAIDSTLPYYRTFRKINKIQIYREGPLLFKAFVSVDKKSGGQLRAINRVYRSSLLGCYTGFFVLMRGHA